MPIGEQTIRPSRGLAERQDIQNISRNFINTVPWNILKNMDRVQKVKSILGKSL